MIGQLFRVLFPDETDRIKRRARKTFRKLEPMIAEINRLYEEFDTLTDEQIRAKTAELKQRVEPHRFDKAALPAALREVLPEAFAAVKQACKRLCGKSWEAGGNTITWDMVPFDEQLAGGIELHRGNIAEMATGEGKTLVAVMPLYLNALSGRGVHLVTVNDYLARRDSEWMGEVFKFLGLSVGCILTNMTPAQRRVAYACDITYGTNNEFGFDYLRDNMAITPEHLVQRDHYYAIVDEVDSVLIDEARTPLIISGTVDRTITQFAELKPMVEALVKKQGALVNRLVGDAEALLKEAETAERKIADEKRYEAGMQLLQSRRSYPKHKRLSKVLNDGQMQKLVTQVENDYMRDKRLNELDEELYFVVDEKGHTIDLTQKGREELSPRDPNLFLIPDLVEVMAEIEGLKNLTPEEKEKRKEAAMAEFETKTETIHCISQLLRAYTLYEKDVEYVVQDSKVVIVDEFTGRLMPGRRWSDGLHQAVEAKEGVTVEKETQTLATITLQNYFRMYEKLAGMTGTAISEESEFAHTYKMDVAVIPTHRKVRRLDDDDLIYKSQREKYNAIVERIQKIHESGMPVLIGTVSVDVSEKLSRLLQRVKISHSVLNAKYHEREAQIVRDAGQTGAVTIATNMAGRGTDIKLGSGVIRCQSAEFDGRCCLVCPHSEGKDWTVDEEMVPCGLQIIGTERHEARRIDRQLRGRSGRQGDPGYSQFYLSLEDDLMRLFASDRMASLMAKGFEEGEAMSHGIATRDIGSAQKKIEDINFERRKRTLEYDDVMNKQRIAIYGLRRRILMSSGPIEDIVLEITGQALAETWAEHGGGEKEPTLIDFDGFYEWIRRSVPLVDLDGLDRNLAAENSQAFLQEIKSRLARGYQTKINFFEQYYRDQLKDRPPDPSADGAPGANMVGAVSRWVLLNIIDSHWRDHLLGIDELREGIHLRSWGQQNPLTEFQREATLLFEDMMFAIRKEAFEHVFRATPIVQAPAPQDQRTRNVSFKKPEAASPTHASQQQAQKPGAGEAEAEANGAADGAPPRPPQQRQPRVPYRRTERKVGPNEPCPCGSGKKYKKCHGAPGAAQPGVGIEPTAS